MTIEEGWGRRVVADRAVLFHRGAGVVGVATKFYDGVSDVYVSRVDEKPVLAPVVELDSGHGFLAQPGAFREMTSEETCFHRSMEQSLVALIRAGGKLIPQSGIDPEAGLELLVATLRSGVAAFSASGTAGNENEGSGDTGNGG